MEEYLEILQKNRLFEGIPCEVIRTAILPYSTVKKYDRRMALFLQNDRVTRVNILLSGRVKLVYYMENGDQDIRNLILPPKLIGVDLICTRTKLSPYQAVAVEPCTVLSFPSELILRPGRLPEKDRLTCTDNLLLILSHINMQNEYRLAILAQNGLRERIRVYLTMQANKAQSKTFRIPFSREEMAAFLRVNRSCLSHELSMMEKEGLLRFSKNEFTLLKDTDEVP